jgi:tetratricopeptide (TPR) repeat protein
VLITSRRRLAALEEAMPISLDMLSPDEAAQLFARLTSRAAGELAAVAEITRLCGYLPLAIRLIAGTLRRHPSWTVADLAAELAATRDRLAAMRAENLSVAAAFDLSYEPLSPGQQRLFRRLGLNPGTSIDVYAAAALDGTSLNTTRRNLDDLYDHHLISEPARGRYRMHDLLREHARTLAEDDDQADREQALDRLLDCYLHAATAANRLIDRHPPSGAPEIPAPAAGVPPLRTSEEAIAWFEAELANLQACAEYAAGHDLLAPAIWIPAQLGEFLTTRGHRDQALAMLHSAVAIAGSTGERAGLAANLASLGKAQHNGGDYPSAMTALTGAIGVYRELAEEKDLARALMAFGIVAINVDDYASAREAFGEALTLVRDLGDLPGQALAIDYLGMLHYVTGDYAAADAALRQALDMFRELGDRQGQADVLRHIGILNNDTGEYEAAIGFLRQAIKIHKELGHRLRHDIALESLGVAQLRTGATDEAASSLAEALEISTQIGDRHGRACVLADLGALSLATGDYARSADYLDQALDLLRDIGDRHGQAGALNTLGSVLAETARPAEGVLRHTEALAITREIGAPLEEADALAGIGRCHLRMGNAAEGAGHLRQALAIYEKIGVPGAERVRQELASQPEA